MQRRPLLRNVIDRPLREVAGSAGQENPRPGSWPRDRLRIPRPAGWMGPCAMQGPWREGSSLLRRDLRLDPVAGAAVSCRAPFEMVVGCPSPTLDDRRERGAKEPTTEVGMADIPLDTVIGQLLPCCAKPSRARPRTGATSSTTIRRRATSEPWESWGRPRPPGRWAAARSRGAIGALAHAACHLGAIRQKVICARER